MLSLFALLTLMLPLDASVGIVPGMWIDFEALQALIILAKEEGLQLIGLEHPKEALGRILVVPHPDAVVGKRVNYLCPAILIQVAWHVRCGEVEGQRGLCLCAFPAYNMSYHGAGHGLRCGRGFRLFSLIASFGSNCGRIRMSPIGLGSVIHYD